MAKAKKKEEVKLFKGKAYFNLVGEAKIGDFTFKIDEIADSGWKYSVMKLGVNCGDGNTVYAEMMGGNYATAEKQIPVYANAKDDFKKRLQIAWDDRKTPEILAEVADFNFVQVGIEKDVNDKTHVVKFISPYDAIEYLNEHLEEGMVVNVKGNLKYSIYNDNVQVKKEINSIFLSKATPDKYKATFVQSILLDKDSVGKFDKEERVFPISARVIDYAKMWGDREVKQNVPYPMNYELAVVEGKENKAKHIIKKFLTVQKGVTEVVVEGDIVESQKTVNISLDDLPDDIRELIEVGVYTEEEILNKQAAGGERVRKYVITKPYVQKTGEGDQAITQTFCEHGKYEEEDLALDFMFADEEMESQEVEEDVDDDDDDWLSELDDDDDEEVPFDK